MEKSNGGEAVRTIGYVRVSTHDQADNGVSLDAQEAKIQAWAELVDAERILGKRSDNRPGIQAALEYISTGGTPWLSIPCPGFPGLPGTPSIWPSSCLTAKICSTSNIRERFVAGILADFH